jgi:hypothetical protein
MSFDRRSKLIYEEKKERNYKSIQTCVKKKQTQLKYKINKTKSLECKFNYKKEIRTYLNKYLKKKTHIHNIKHIHIHNIKQTKQIHRAHQHSIYLLVSK